MNKKFLFTDYFELEDLKNDLRKAGINKFYEKENGTLIIQESDIIQVKIIVNNKGTFSKAKFPQIGNLVQIISTIIFLVILAFVFPIPGYFVLAIILGQLTSFAYYYSKIVKFQNKVNDTLKQLYYSNSRKKEV